MLVIISFLKNPTGNNAIYSYFPKTDIFKVLGCKSIDKYIQLLVLFPSGSYAFSYTINKPSCLSVLLKNIRNISRHFPFSQFISLFLVQWKKANRSRQKWQTHGQRFKHHRQMDFKESRGALWGKGKDREKKHEARIETQAAEQREILSAGCPFPGALRVENRAWWTGQKQS